jgi:hypothetical protein
LWGAIGAVFGSWMNARAITYRRLHAIPESWGTAVNVQAMVFGNMGEDCATGVAFTRDPSTGANLFYGEYLVNAQGEDVVAGIRTPQHLTVQGKEAQKSDAPAMEETMPEVFKQLDKAYPGSKFILTMRPEAAWLRSVERHWDPAIVVDKSFQIRNRLGDHRVVGSLRAFALDEVDGRGEGVDLELSADCFFGRFAARTFECGQ